MIATSEHPLTSMYMDEVIEPSLLPIKMVGVSPCFERGVLTVIRPWNMACSSIH